MKTLGLIGGTSWISTIDYYRIINQEVNTRLGGLTSAKLFLYSLNYEEFKPPPDPANWEPVIELLLCASKKLENAGADCIVLCANTPHMFADTIQQNISIPLIHIAIATAKEIMKQRLNKVGLLGTKFTMEQKFFTERLSKYGIETLIPGNADREFIHRSIFEELGMGMFKDETKKRYLKIIKSLIDKGAEGIILGCTEIPLLVKKEECSVPVFDTTIIHAKAAVDFALNDRETYG